MKPLFLAALLSLVTSGPGTGQQTPPCCTATIRIRVPERTGVVYLTGSLAQLGPWRADGLALTGRGRERTARITVPSNATFEYKFTLGNWDGE